MSSMHPDTDEIKSIGMNEETNLPTESERASPNVNAKFSPRTFTPQKLSRSNATLSPNIADLWNKGSSARDGLPLLSKVLESHAWSDGRVACGVASMRGFRAKMEDSASILRPLSESSRDSYRFCGVFDGHAQSREVAMTLEDLLPRRIGSLKQGSWMTKSGLEQACLSTDKEILLSENSDAGSTAIFCVIEKAKEGKHVAMTLGSVGDSQAVIVHGAHAGPPTVPFSSEVHRPHLMEVEADRIRKAGGFVAHGRVDGELAVSRAFGDSKYKKDISRKLSEQKVVATPSVVENLILHIGDTMILGCDGLFDFMTALQIDTFVRGILLSVLVNQRKGTECTNGLWNVSEGLAEVAGKLIDESLLRGSRDNMTVMVIQVVPTNSSTTDWLDKFSKKYIPPIMFRNCPIGFMAMVKEELRALGLDEDLTLSDSIVLDDQVIPFGLTRSQLAAILQTAMNKQWENRDSWIRLGNFEVPNHRFAKSYKSPANQKKPNWFICCKQSPKFMYKRGRGVSASLGPGFENISSVHPGENFEAIIDSRQTSAD